MVLAGGDGRRSPARRGRLRVIGGADSHPNTVTVPATQQTLPLLTTATTDPDAQSRIMLLDELLHAVCVSQPDAAAPSLCASLNASGLG